MRRIYGALASIISVGFGGTLGIVYERRRQTVSSIGCLPAVLAKGEPDSSLSSLHHDINESKGKSALKASRLSDIMRFGFPGLENIKAKDDYVLSYNRRLRLANWVCEHLTAETVRRRVADRSKCDFVQDQAVHPFFRATNDDYRKSGYDRGHLAAAANHRQDQDMNCQTFVLSNMSPQVGQNFIALATETDAGDGSGSVLLNSAGSGFNRDSWGDLEKHVRHLTKVYKNVYVITGPLFLPKQENDGNLWIRYKVIGKNRVAVPTHFFKVVLGETRDQKLEMQSYILPNQPISEKTSLHKFQVPVETIEKASGLVMFDKVQKRSITEVRPVFS